MSGWLREERRWRSQTKRISRGPYQGGRYLRRTKGIPHVLGSTAEGREEIIEDDGLRWGWTLVPCWYCVLVLVRLGFLVDFT